MIGVYHSAFVSQNLNGVPSKYAPPTFRNATPRTPPRTPIGVSIASISGKRSSTLAKTALWPTNSRYSYPRISELPPKYRKSG